MFNLDFKTLAFIIEAKNNKYNLTFNQWLAILKTKEYIFYTALLSYAAVNSKHKQ